MTLDMAMHQPDRMAGTLNEIFDRADWKSRVDSQDFDDRARQTVDLFKETTGARWATCVRMLGDNQATRYLLAHFTNHDAGRDLMKDVVWKICPEGGFYARKSDDPNQEYLIRPEPDLRLLQPWVRSKLPCRWKELESAVRETIWRVPHLNDVVRALRKSGDIEPRDYTGKFTPSANPELHWRASTPP